MSATIPSPIPPFARPPQTPLYEVLTAAGAISLVNDPTFLDVATGTVAMTLAAGSYIGQFKQIYIRKSDLIATGTFNVTGTFAGFTSLQFDATHFNALLIYDGGAWQMVAGNATKV